MTDDFIIDQVSWHTQAENTESREHVHHRFRTIAKFLDSNGLTRRPISKPVDDSFAIRSTDLTDEGLQVMRKSYDSWLRAQDRGQSPDDLRLIEKALAKLRKV